MYQLLLSLHSITRWLVLLSLFYTIWLSIKGMVTQGLFTRVDNLARHLTATVIHVQLLLGLYLYTISPVVKVNFELQNTGKIMDEQLFFKYLHIGLMIAAVVLVTIGSAKTKRIQADRLKFSTMLAWYTAALMIILIAIPWPFSPLSNRPLLRPF